MLFWNKLTLKQVFLLSLVILLSVWTLRLVQTHYNGYFLGYTGITNYHSDDTAQANILWEWQNGYKGGAVVGDDNWIIKYPIYIFTNNLPIQPIWRLFLNSLITTYITAGLMMIAIYGFSKLLIAGNKNKQKLTVLLTSLVLASIGQEAFGVIKMPNSRNIELGIFMLLTFALLAYELKPKLFKNNKKLKLIGLIVMIGILCANDPMFIYLGLAPLGLLVVIRYFFVNQKLSTTVKYLAFMFFGLIVTFLFKKLILLLPLNFAHHEGKLIQPDVVFKNLPELIESNMRILGVNVFDTLEHFSKAWFLYSSIIAIIVVLSIWAVFFKTIIKDKFKGPVTISYVALLWVWIPLVYSFSTLSDPPSATGRYLILLNALFIVSLILLFSITNKRRQLIALGGMIFILLTIVLIKNTKSLLNHGLPNGNNFTIIKAVEDEGLTKGYAGLFTAGINDYLSNHKVNIAPVLCRNSKLVNHDIFINKDRVKEATNQSFFIYKTNGPSETIDCSPEVLVPQFGDPAKVIPVMNGDAIIAIYDYDIGNNITKPLEYN